MLKTRQRHGARRPAYPTGEPPAPQAPTGTPARPGPADPAGVPHRCVPAAPADTLEVRRSALERLTAERTPESWTLLTLSTTEAAGATVSFSVPEHVKKTFDKAFAGMNERAIVAHLMRQAVDERRRQEQRRRVIERLLRLRRTIRPAAEATVRAARVDLRRTGPSAPSV